MRPLIIGQEEKLQLSTLRQFAEYHPYSMDDMLDVKNGELAAPGLVREYQRLIPFEFKVVFTVEEHVKGKYRHLSVSIPGGKYPSIEAVGILMEELGFVQKIGSSGIIVFMEEQQFINVMEQIV